MTVGWRKKSRWWEKGLAAIGVLAVSGTAADSRAPAAPRPALWKVADRDTTIYLFGTIHLLPQGTAWQSPTFAAAARSSDSLIVETIIDEKNPAALSGTMMRLGLSNGLPPIEQRVAPARRAALATAIARSRVPVAALNRMETWAAAFTLMGSQFADMQLRQDAGVETALKQQFSAAGKPIGQLETNAEQLGFFDALPEKAQRNLLEGAIEQPQAARKQFDAMLGAWSRGDVAAIGRTFNAELASEPALRELLLERRNANWTRWIEGRMGRPGAVMVAVGAGHLAGRDSVQAMLGKRGWKVTRIQ